MRVRVLEWCGGEQRACFAQVIANWAIGRINLGIDDRAYAAAIFGLGPSPIGAIPPIALHREHRVDTIGLAQREVILAMVGRHMDEPGARIGRDER